MAKRPRPAKAEQLKLFPAPNDEEIWKKPFTIELLSGQELRLNLETVRRLQKLELPPSALGAPRSTS